MILVILASTSWAQNDAASLSGSITDSAGKAVPNVQVSVKNLATGEHSETQTDASGAYSLSNLTPGDYEISGSAPGFETRVAKTTLSAGSKQTLDLALAAQQPQPETPANPAAPQQNLPNAPSSSQTAPTLEDLGISRSDVQGNAQQQALLDKRTHMLKVHQRLGLITAVPMIATVITSFSAGGRQTSTTSRDLHAALGSATAGLYFTSAYFAIRAPKIQGTEARGPIRLHKALAWIHGPGMVLTPILGAIAFDQKSKGEKVHGIAKAHGPVAIVTAGAFGAALLSVSLKF